MGSAIRSPCSDTESHYHGSRRSSGSETDRRVSEGCPDPVARTRLIQMATVSRIPVIWLLLAVGVASSVGTVSAGRQLARDEALSLAFPGAMLSASRLFLTEDQMAAAAARAGVPVPTPLIARYSARANGILVGRAYIDTHVVRTKKESLLISLDATGRVKRVDVVAFLEPSEYLAPDLFLDQFSGRGLEEDLRVQRAIRPIAGATLTVGAVTEAVGRSRPAVSRAAAAEAVRRVLAIDAVLESTGRGAGEVRR